jgi:hypothetical protein
MPLQPRPFDAVLAVEADQVEPELPVLNRCLATVSPAILAPSPGQVAHSVDKVA